MRNRILSMLVASTIACFLSAAAVALDADTASAHRAPHAMGDCAEMAAYRRAVGLPARFDRIGRRESGCNNAMYGHNRNGTHDHGWWQANDVIWRDHRMKPKVRACGAPTPMSIVGSDPASKMRSACVAKALYDTVGWSPWR